MHRAQWQRHPLGANKLRTLQSAPALQKTRLFKDLVQSAHLAGFVQEETNGFLEIGEGFLPDASTRGNIQFMNMDRRSSICIRRSVRNRGARLMRLIQTYCASYPFSRRIQIFR
jgi:hypothetical protein